MGIIRYNPCHRKVIALVTYKSGLTGKKVKENVCKMHLNSTKKFAIRLKEKLDYDVKLKITELL